MDAATLKQCLEQEEVVVVDVREPLEYAASNIPGSVLIPLATISYEALPVAENHKLVLHCRSGGRSLHACQQLLQEKPSLDVYNLEGGILAWEALGYPIEASGAD